MIAEKNERIVVVMKKFDIELRKKIEWAAKLENRDMSGYFRNLAILDVEKKEKEMLENNDKKI